VVTTLGISQATTGSVTGCDKNEARSVESARPLAGSAPRKVLGQYSTILSVMSAARAHNGRGTPRAEWRARDAAPLAAGYTGAEVPHLLVNNVPTIMTSLRELEPLSYSKSRKSSLTTPAEGEEGET